MASLLATALALSQVFAGPVPRQTCEGQSCTIAALSGSSGQPFEATTAPANGTTAGDCCIISYNPAVAPALYKLNPDLQSACATNLTSNRATSQRRQISCLPYTLVYAVGTTETPPLGVTVGPALANGLQAAQPGNWSIQGVNYNSSIDGDYCLGLPGGAFGTQLIDEVAESCLDTKIVVAGYSQGAMVAHNVRSIASK